MKKLLFILFIMPLFLFLSTTVLGSETVTEIDIHYYRYTADYTGWNLWAWQSEPTSAEGESYAFIEDDTASTFNYGGVVTKLTLEGSLSGATRIGMIVRLNDWAEKDIGTDRFIDIPATTDDGILHIYLVEGDSRIGYSIDDPDGPDRYPKFRSAYFTEMDTITFSATEELATTDITVTADDVPINVDSIVIDDTDGTITLESDLDFSKKYVITATFSDDYVNSYAITFDGVYDSDAFNDTFGYEGDDLGAYVIGNKTTFRVWAPVSQSVTLNLYDTGTPLAYGGTNTPTDTIVMTPDEKGTFYTEILSNLHGTYYTYSVTNGTNTNEVIDPYAKSSGINGIRGLIVDFSQTNPTGFEYDDRPDNMTNATDAIIYELHVRDLTSHMSWNGTEANRAKYLGLIESGTSYEGVSTGFDHIVDLGVTHVQLLPFFDFGVLDESKIGTTGYNSFNWGYMPINFNVLEGSYSANPYDGLIRIEEMKQVISGFGDENIRVNMDVVYNHTGLTADSNLNLIVPGYYYRKTASGAFSNGSGTGNETASERFMMRKFMIESAVFWATEYNISGFRFDLMALHDIETMNELTTALHEIDDTIMVYGEPWTGGTTPLSSTEQAGKSNLYLMDDVAAFNDDLRDGVKGSVFNREEGGFVQGMFTSQNLNKVKYGIVGGIDNPAINGGALSNMKIWHTSPLKTINYVTAHDNNTLHDKLYITLEQLDKLELLPKMMKQSNAIVLLSQGISFLHAGDEFMRSKPAASGTGFDHNSYESPDSVNQLRWDQKAEQMDMVNYYAGLIAFRKAHPSLRMTTAVDINNNLEFVYENVTGVIAYTLTNTASNDTYEKMLIIHNANTKSTRIKLPTNGGWVLVLDGEQANDQMITSFKGGEAIKVAANSTYVMYQDITIEDVNYLPVILISSIGGTALLAGGIFVFFRFRKPKII